MRIAIESITKSFGALKALDGVSLDIEPGQIVAVVGPNGAGKTTLLRCLSTVIVPDRGQIRMDGELLLRERLDLRRRFVFLPDFPPLLPEYTLLQHVSMLLRLHEKIPPQVEERLLDVLRDLDLVPLAQLKVSTYSRGQAYKAALAGLLMVDPELWLLDEPFASGMDPHGIISFKRHAREAAQRGTTVIFTTQLIDLAEQFSDRVCVIHKGRVHAWGPIAELRQKAGSEQGVLEQLFVQLRESDA